jgi:hypothetical protein
MLHRPPARRRKRTEAQARWRQREREGRRIVRVAIDGSVLNWLERHYSGQCDLGNLDDVGRLPGEILESSAKL